MWESRTIQQKDFVQRKNRKLVENEGIFWKRKTVFANCRWLFVQARFCWEGDTAVVLPAPCHCLVLVRRWQHPRSPRLPRLTLVRRWQHFRIGTSILTRPNDDLVIQPPGPRHWSTKRVIPHFFVILEISKNLDESSGQIFKILFQKILATPLDFFWWVLNLLARAPQGPQGPVGVVPAVVPARGLKSRKLDLKWSKSYIAPIHLTAGSAESAGPPSGRRSSRRRPSIWPQI